MATTKNATYKVYNGTDWDTIYFATSAAQVGESSTLKFLRPSVNTVNGKAFTTTSGITLYGSDIKYSSSSDTSILDWAMVQFASKASSTSLNTDGIVTNSAEAGLLSSGKSFESTLTNSDSKVPTSKAVYDAISGFTGDYLPSTGGSLSGDLTVNGDTLVTGELQVSSHIVMNRNNSDSIIVGSIIINDGKSGKITCTDVVTTNENKANGLLRLDSGGLVPSTFLPSYVDDVIECSSSDAMPGDGEAGKIYVTLDDNKTWRWSGTQYVEISASLALGTTSSTAYRGDHGLIVYNHSQAAHAPSNAQANVIETIKVAGTALTPSSKAVNITLSSFGITATKDEINDVTYKLGIVSSSASLSGILTGNGTLNGVSGSGKSFESTLTDNDTKVPTSKAVTTAINALHKLFTGSTTPTEMKTGDVWLQYS